MRNKQGKDYFVSRRPKKLRGNGKPDGWYYERNCYPNYSAILDFLDSRVGQSWAEIRSLLFSRITKPYYRDLLRSVLSRNVTEYKHLHKLIVPLTDGDYYVDAIGMLCKYNLVDISCVPKFQAYIKDFSYDNYDYELGPEYWTKSFVYRDEELDYYLGYKSLKTFKLSLSLKEMEWLYANFVFAADHRDTELVNLSDEKHKLRMQFRVGKFLAYWLPLSIRKAISTAFNLDSIPYRLRMGTVWVRKSEWDLLSQRLLLNIRS